LKDREKKVTEGETAVTFTDIKEVNKLLKQDTRLALRELSASLNVTKKEMSTLCY